MDENDKQKSTDNNASTRPGIFSTPDLTIDAEKIAQSAPSPDANKTRVASFFANTDATRQAQQPTIVSQPLEGDIVINNSPKKRGKLLATVLAVATAIIATAIIILTIAGSNAKNTEMLRSSFNKYANFLLAGVESPYNFEQIYSGTEYVYSFMSRVYDDNEARKKYFDKLQELYREFVLQTKHTNVYSSHEELINGYGDAISSYAYYATITDLDESKIAEDYFVRGYDSARNLAKSMYAPLLDNGDAYAKNLGDYYERKAILFLDTVAAYENAGCITNRQIMASCNSPDAPHIDINNDENIDSVENGIVINVQSLQNEIIEDCWRIYNEVLS